MLSHSSPIDSSSAALATFPTSQQQRTLHRQQVRLFCHLGQILCHLCTRIAWSEVSPSQQRRLLPLIETLQAGLLGADDQLRQRPKPL